MNDYTSVRRTTEMYIVANYTTTYIRLENEGIPSDTPEFIALRDQATFSESMGMGESAMHLGGVMLVDIFTAKGSGTNRSRTIASEIADLLASETIEMISFTEAELHTVGEIEDAEYFQQVLQIPYSYIYGQ